MHDEINQDHFPYFWRLQLVYWGAFGLMTMATLMMWSDSISPLHVVLVLFHTALAVALSFPLHSIYTLIWDIEINARVIISVLCVAIGAGFWTILRGLLVQITITEDKEWLSIGAWYLGMFYAFLGWAAFYHGIKYFFMLQEEHDRALDAETAASNEQVKRLQAESKAKDAKLKMLRYQLNPHFLFNTLNAITSLIRNEANKRAQEITIKLSQFLRFTLDNNPNTKIPLKQEMNVLGMYLDIEKTRFQERLMLEINIQKESENALIPSLLLQPLLENSMKYAIAASEDGGTVQVSAHLSGKDLELSVTDTGAGTQTPVGVESRGVGLRNTLERLKTLYKDNYSFETINTPDGGFTALIKFPYRPALTTATEENVLSQLMSA